MTQSWSRLCWYLGLASSLLIGGTITSSGEYAFAQSTPIATPTRIDSHKHHKCPPHCEWNPPAKPGRLEFDLELREPKPKPEESEPELREPKPKPEESEPELREPKPKPEEFDLELRKPKPKPEEPEN